MKRANDICSVVDDHEFPAPAFLPPYSARLCSTGRRDTTSKLALACRNSSEKLRFFQAHLNNHIFVIFHCTAYSKESLERSFFYLNVDALFNKIGLEATEKCLFEDDQFTLFDHADAFDRRRSPLFWGLLWELDRFSNPVAAMGAIHKMAATLGDSPTGRALRGNFSSQRSLPHLAKHFSLGFLFLLRVNKPHTNEGRLPFRQV